MAVFGLLALGSSIVGGVGAYHTAKKRHASDGATLAATTSGILAGPAGWAVSAIVLPKKEEGASAGEPQFDRHA